MVYRDNRVRHILDNLPALVAILDQGFHYRFANRQHANWFGESPEALTGRHVAEVIGKQAFDVLLPCYEDAMNGGSAGYSGELPFPRGGQRFIYATSMALSVQTDEDFELLVTMTDISELKNTQRALDTTTRQSHTILDTAVDVIVTIDSRGIIQSCNSSTEVLFGYPANELLGQNVNMLMPDYHASEHDNYLKRYLETGAPHIIGIGRDIMAKKRDGSEFPAHLAVGEFTDRGRQYFTGFIRDMTAQKRAEQEARAHLDEIAHLTRLNAIESIASGIMHEINQPLTAIVSMSQALLRMQRTDGAKPEVLEDVLDRIVNQCVRASSIVKQMREMARKSASTDRTQVSLEDLVNQVGQLLEHEINQNEINLVARLETQNLALTVNRIQIEQVLLNLLQNAIHAMAANEGERNLEINSRTIDSTPPMLEVSIKDNGIGLPQEELGDIFDPFFTTKEKGMGQGLSISRRIIENHGGKIGATSDPEGTVFRFTLPLTEAADG